MARTNIVNQVHINELPLGLHEGRTLSLRSINYLFGANGSGKTQVLKRITRAAKEELSNAGKIPEGYFAKYIPTIQQTSVYNESQQILSRGSSLEDYDAEEVRGDIFYQHLTEFPEITIRVRDALQKYLGRYPHVVKRGINHVMRFFREDQGLEEYAANTESDGLRRLAILLSYIYHPKCLFLGIDEPELHLHPDMISFLLEEIEYEAVHGKQFVLATHNPEFIKIGPSDTFAYFYFDLHDKIRESQIISSNENGVDKLIKEVDYLLDANRRAFLYAPITLFVEGLADEIVYSKIKHEGLVEWGRRIFMVQCGGRTSLFNFWRLWRGFKKSTRVILDAPKQGKDEKEFLELVEKFCEDLAINKSLSLSEKRIELEKHSIYIAEYTDVLIFGEKNIELDDFSGAFKHLDTTLHVNVLQKAVKYDDTLKAVLRDIESGWLIEIGKEFSGLLMQGKDLKNAFETLKKNHPTLEITTDETTNVSEIKVRVNNHRELYIQLAERFDQTKYGVRDPHE